MIGAILILVSTFLFAVAVGDFGLAFIQMMVAVVSAIVWFVVFMSGAHALRSLYRIERRVGQAA